MTRREVRDQFRDWRIIVPVLVLTIFFPWLMNFTARQATSFVERYGASLVGDRLIPFLLMIVGFFPISVSLVIALESFVGEKERGSIEPLLVSPLSDWQLYLGKLIAAVVPPLLASYLGIMVYLIGIYISVEWQPNPILLTQIILLTTVHALVMVSGAVVVSSQTTSVRAANLLASFIIIPMVLLIQVESVIMFWAQYTVLWWVILGQIVIAGLLLRTGVAHFNREELLGKEFDTLNIRRGWRTYSASFIGEAHSLGQWYTQEVSQALRQMYKPILIVTLTLLAGVWIGTRQASIFVLPPETLNLQNIDQGFLEGLDSIPFFSAAGIGTIWWHNLRVILLATVLGIFSFGVLAAIILMLPFILIGYFMASVAGIGLHPLTFLVALVLPHGLLEIPAIILAGAAILRLGATLAAPASG
ncbi:MAG: stage II sporulation protein M, partial [Anaerolineales bacterium]|nr:stage II sporulation protein M [Anaerolineales bacterium]